MCIDSGRNPASLQVRKIYQVLPDPDAARYDLLRIIDEDEDGSYLYPKRLFIPVRFPRPLPRAARRAFSCDAKQ
jgi:hypothetical protein